METHPLTSSRNQSEFQTYEQASAGDSPWSLAWRIKMLVWGGMWALFCRWTPKPLNRWRLIWLKLFGAEIYGSPFVHQRARITIPWNLTMYDKSCLGDGAHVYNLAPVIIHQEATVAQEAYLCAGTHDFTQPHIPLKTAPIIVGAFCFIGARAFVLPGVQIGSAAVVGACSVVSRDVPADTTVAGNPARLVKQSGRAIPVYSEG